MSRYESLECLLSRQRIVVPVRHLDRVIEIPVSAPPPLAEPWVAGLGLVADRPLVCVTLSGEGRGPLVLSKGLLLNAPGWNERYLLQVDEVRSIRDIEDEGFEPTEVAGWPCPTGWLTARPTAGEGPLLRLESSAVADTLFGSEAVPTFARQATA